ncbi:MAG: ATP-binding protein [Crocinitomicaceae bacterium]|nr:MAG: ATP-binding protein [Crocinitomicaceae bacterium]
MIDRILQQKVKQHIENNKILVLLGPKSVGKNQLVRLCIADQSTILQLDGNSKVVKKSLENPTESTLKAIFGTHKYIVIDDAQYLLHLQTIIEEVLFQDYPINLILNCSFEPILDDVLREVLQMQGLELRLYPLLFQELAQIQGIVEFDKNITQRLIYGNYPQVIEDPANASHFLIQLLEEAIFTNLSPNERINKSDKLLKMLQALAFQLGEPISYNDIGFKAGLDNETVERYIELLEKACILIKIPSYYNGHKYELKKTHCVYFVDNGIRNAIIRNFNDFELRNDHDVLWKNWLISERIKWNQSQENTCQYAFWRTHTKQQMDFLEIRGDKVTAYKSIWDKRKKPKFPASFKTAYPDATLFALNRATYWGFLSKK